jgi:hypothetical protein
MDESIDMVFLDIVQGRMSFSNISAYPVGEFADS